MSRRPRNEETGIPYHIIVRGNNRECIFHANECYLRYIGLLRGYKKICRYKLYGYSLIPNHIHLIMEASENASISKIMQRINTSYTIYINKKYKRTGHVLEGRYKAKKIETDEYLLQVSKYVHMNAVKAALCTLPEDYACSSAKAYIAECRDDLIDTDLILGLFDKDSKVARDEYKKYLLEQDEIDTSVVNITSV